MDVDTYIVTSAGVAHRRHSVVSHVVVVVVVVFVVDVVGVVFELIISHTHTHIIVLTSCMRPPFPPGCGSRVSVCGFFVAAEHGESPEGSFTATSRVLLEIVHSSMCVSNMLHFIMFKKAKMFITCMLF